MQPAPKRRRSRTLGSELHRKISSCFEAVSTIQAIDGLERSSRQSFWSCKLALPQKLASSLDLQNGVGLRRFSCVSSADGKEKLRGLENCATKQVARHYVAWFMEKDPHEVPLCCVAFLLCNGFLGLADISSSFLAEKVAQSLEDGVPCGCDEEGNPPLRLLVDGIFSCGQSTVRDECVQALLGPLVCSRQTGWSETRIKNGFWVAIKVIDALEELALVSGEGKDLIKLFAERSLKVRDRAEIEGIDASKNAWTADLLTIAVTPSTDELFQGREQEMESLDMLYGCLSSLESVDMVVELLAKGLEMSASGEYKLGDRVSSFLNWNRVIRLLRRGCDSRLRGDVTGSEVTTVESFIMSSLGAGGVPREPGVLAVLFAISRALYRFGRNEKSEDDAERGFRGYEKWLARACAASGKPVLKTLCLVLEELVPAEPVRYLRANVRVLTRLSAAGSSEHVASYCRVARLRLRKLEDDSIEGAGSSGGAHIASRDQRVARSRLDACKFVAEFASRGEKLPSSFARMLNFHRFYFRTNVLPALLSPDLNPPEALLEVEFPQGGIQDFNGYRVKMIKQMSFQREDKVIGRNEAECAIHAIDEHTARLLSHAKKTGQENPTDVGPAKEDFAEDTEILEFISHIVELVRELGGTVDVETRESGSGRLGRVCSAFNAKCAKVADADLADFASEFLDCLIQRITRDMSAAHMSERQESQTKGESRHEVSADCIAAALTCDGTARKWAEKSLSWLAVVFQKLLSGARLAKIRRALQCRILILICAQTEELSSGHALSCAMLLLALSSVPVEDESYDLCCVLKKGVAMKAEALVDSIVCHLHISSSLGFLRSVQLAVAYLRLHLAYQAPARTLVVHEDSQEVACGLGRGSSTPAVAMTPTFRLDDKHQEQHESPQGMLQFTNLIRWGLLCPWRLLDSQALGNSHQSCFGPVDSMCVAREDAIVALKAVMLYLQGSDISAPPLSIDTWVSFEMRAGSGRVENVIDVLQSFQACGTASLHVAVSACRSISIRSKLLNKRAHNFSADITWDEVPWLVIGIQAFVDKSGGASRNESPGKLLGAEVAGLSSFATGLHAMMESPPAEKFAFADLLFLMPPGLYFGNATRYDVFEHVADCVMAGLGPLDEMATRFYVKAFTSWKSSSLLEGVSSTPPNALVVCASVHWPALAMTFDSGDSVTSREACMLFNPAEELWEVLHELLSGSRVDVAAPACGSSTVNANEYGFSESCIARALELVHREPGVFGAALVFRVLHDIAATPRSQWEAQLQSLSVVLDVLCREEDMACVDMLGACIDIVARYPLSGSSRRSVLCQLDSVALAREIALRFLNSHISLGMDSSLLFGPTDGPVEDDDVSCVSRIRADVGLVCPVVDRKSAMWDSNAKLSRSFAWWRVAGCLAGLEANFVKAVVVSLEKGNASDLVGWLCRAIVDLREISRTGAGSSIEKFVDELRVSLPELERDLELSVQHVLKASIAARVNWTAIPRELERLSPVLWCTLQDVQYGNVHK